MRREMVAGLACRYWRNHQESTSLTDGSHHLEDRQPLPSARPTWPRTRDS